MYEINGPDSPRSDESYLIGISRIRISCVTRSKDFPPSFSLFPKCQNSSWTLNSPDLSLINGCELIANSCFVNSHELYLWPFQVTSPRKADRSPCIPPDGWSWQIWDFAYPDSHTPVQLQKGFKPCACSPDLTVVRVLLSSNIDSMAPTLLVWSSLSLCGHIPHRLQFYNTATPPKLCNMVKQPIDT